MQNLEKKVDVMELIVLMLHRVLSSFCYASAELSAILYHWCYYSLNISLRAWCTLLCRHPRLTLITVLLLSSSTSHVLSKKCVYLKHNLSANPFQTNMTGKNLFSVCNFSMSRISEHKCHSETGHTAPYAIAEHTHNKGHGILLQPRLSTKLTDATKRKIRKALQFDRIGTQKKKTLNLDWLELSKLWPGERPGKISC